MTIDSHVHSRFTMTLGELVTGIGGPETYCEAVLSGYPILHEEHRDELNRKLLAHYWFREIGQETGELFNFMLARELNEQMPTFNELYRSLDFKFDPLHTIDMHTTGDVDAANLLLSTGSEASDSHVDATGKTRATNSAYPQTQLRNTGDYADSATDTIADNDTSSTDKRSSTGKSDGKSKQTTKTHQYGYAQSPSELLQLWRSNIINVDLSVIDSVSGLFMLIDSDNVHVGQRGYTRYNVPFGLWGW